MNVIFFNGRPKSGIHLLTIAEMYGKSCFNPKKNEWEKCLLNGEMQEQYQNSYFQKNIFKNSMFFLSGHYRWTSAKERFLRIINCKMVLIIRDLRDCVTAGYRAFKIQHLTAGSMEQQQVFNTYNNDKEKIIEDMILDRFAGGGTAPKHFESGYFPWMKTDFCYVTKFEKLVGSKGGGDDSIQRKEFQRICEFIGLPQTNEWYQRNVLTLYNPKIGSFIPGGGVGSYKKYFSKRNIETFEAVAGELHKKMGYEK